MVWWLLNGNLRQGYKPKTWKCFLNLRLKRECLFGAIAPFKIGIYLAKSRVIIPKNGKTDYETIYVSHIIRTKEVSVCHTLWYLKVSIALVQISK